MLFLLLRQINVADGDSLARMVELWFIFCMVWSICGSVDEDGRKKIDNYIREIEAHFPNKVLFVYRRLKC